MLKFSLTQILFVLFVLWHSGSGTDTLAGCLPTLPECRWDWQSGSTPAS